METERKTETEETAEEPGIVKLKFQQWEITYFYILHFVWSAKTIY